MTEPKPNASVHPESNSASSPSRRTFLKTTGQVAATSALAGVAVPSVHAAESNTIQVALVGCGGRGTGAAANALATKSGPIKLVAMADVFEDKLARCAKTLSREPSDKVDVPDDRKFLGFDGYQKAMDCLNPGDVVILATPPAFRWVHFTYAIQKGLNTFMEKPRDRRRPDHPQDARAGRAGEGEGPEGRRRPHVPPLRGARGAAGSDQRRRDRRHRHAPRLSPDGPGRLGPGRAPARRHQRADVPDPQVPRVPLGQRRLLQRLPDPQHRRMLLDEGGVAGRGQGVGRPRTTAATSSTRTSTPTRSSTPSTTARSSSSKAGTSPAATRSSPATRTARRAAAIISTASHTPAKCRIYKGQKFTRDDVVWAFPPPEPNPYQIEWDRLIDAIRKDKHHNEVKRGAKASLVTSMGRMAAHTGQKITLDDMLNCRHEFAPDVDKLAMNSPRRSRSTPRWATTLAAAGHQPRPRVLNPAACDSAIEPATRRGTEQNSVPVSGLPPLRPKESRFAKESLPAVPPAAAF